MPRNSQDMDRLVGQRLSQMRQARGLSQTALAEHLGVSFQQVQKYEKGINRISASRLYQLTQIMQCTVGDLFPKGHTASDHPDSLTQLFSTGEGLAMATAYAQITDPLLRQSLCQIAVALAKA